MKLSIRVKFLLAVFSVVLLGLSVTGAYLSSTLRRNITNRARLELAKQSSVANILVSRVLSSRAISEGDKIADEIGEASNLRVTIILEDGTVIGDSELTYQEVVEVQSHKDRPEVIAALKTGEAFSMRYSVTIGYDMIYAATRFSNETASGVVRVSRPLEEIDEAMAVLYGSLATSGVVILALSLLMALFFSAYFARILNSMVNFAESLAEGKRASSAMQTTGELGGLTKPLQSLSERLEGTMEELAEERDRFEAVLGGMSEAVMALDQDKRVTVINPSAIMLLELGKKPVGQTLLETIRIPGLVSILDKVRPGEELVSEFDHTGAVPRTLLARIAHLSSGAYVLVLRDVTELRRLERVRRDFVSNVSHELRTPISVVQANAETLLDGALDDKVMASKFLSSIVTNSNRLTNLIGDLLDLTRIEEEKLELVLEPVKIDDAFGRALAALETKAMKKGQKLDVQSAKGIEVIADEGALDQVLFNLLDNAVNYTGDKGEITLNASEADEEVLVEVTDNGPGISEEHRERLFERFYRVDKGRSREVGGTGLGLAIAKHLVVAMQGDIGMRPAENGGSVFFIKLQSAG